jgi:hypothetical protein
MQTEAIIATLLAAAAILKQPVQDVAAQSIKDVYEAAKYYLRKKFGDGSDGAKFLDLALEKPESAMRKSGVGRGGGVLGRRIRSRFASVDRTP